MNITTGESIIVRKDVSICCGCLATEGEIVALKAIDLIQDFMHLSGIKLQDCRSWWICNVCIYFLRKFRSYKLRVRQSANILLQAYSNDNALVSVNKGSPLSRFDLTVREPITISPDSEESAENDSYKEKDIKIEIDGDTKIEFPLKPHLNDVVNVTECCSEQNENIIEFSQENPFEDVKETTDPIASDDEQVNLNNDGIDDQVLNYDESNSNDDKNDEIEETPADLESKYQSLKKKCSEVGQKLHHAIKKHLKVSDLMRIENIKARAINNADYEFLVFNKPLKRLLGEYKRSLKDLSSLLNVRVDFTSINDQKQELDSLRASELYQKALYKCHLCCKMFKFQSKLEAHASWHEGTKGLVCEICKRRYSNSRKLNAHYQRVHTKKITCLPCGTVSTTWEETREHYKHKHETYLIPCQWCDKKFSRQKFYLGHLQEAHKNYIPSVLCMLCNDMYNGEHGLRVHVIKAHSRAIRCETCPNLFRSSEALSAHNNNGCRDGHSSCPECGVNFESEKLTRDHFESEHNNVEYECPECTRRFPTVFIYKKHVHWLKGRLQPTIVPKGSPSSQTTTVRRRRTNSAPLGGPPYVCHVCGRSGIKTRTLFLYHMRIHTGEKPYKCSKCPRAFRLHNLMKEHEYTHSNLKPFSCSLCPYKGGSNSNFKRHMVTHTGEKRYGCGMCDKRFTNTQNRNEHIRTAHEGLPPKLRQPRKRNKKNNIPAI